jgi:23S rRNA (uracil1939-C5)-methyltransferase
MTINDKYTVEIFDYSTDGDGVAKLENGCVVFVEGAVRGDICEIMIIKVLSRACYAKIEKIITPSPHRIPIDCPVFGCCGGCDYRHISYEEELYAKRKKVNDALRRIGDASIEIEDILSTGKTNGYRNNIQLKIDGQKIGFYSIKSHDVVDIDECLLVPEDTNKAIRDMRKQLNGNSGRRSVKIRTSTEILDNLTFHISEESFFQVNTEGALLLYEKAREYADLKPHEFLLDLYCGTGTITLFLCRDAKRASGVEMNARAVADAKKNAAFNNIHNVDFLCGDVSKLTLSGLTADCIVVDPPRKGLSAEALHKIEELSPAKIVYISCDAATLARDIKRLNNYEVKRACAVDMFPRTKHVECIAKLCRKNI